MEQKLNRVLRAAWRGGRETQSAASMIRGREAMAMSSRSFVTPRAPSIYASRFQLGDPTLSLLELWGAEYQESNAVLTRAGALGWLQAVATRERCPLEVVGTVTGDGRIVLVDDLEAPVQEFGCHQGLATPVNLELEWVLGKVPQKVFHLSLGVPPLRPLSLPPGLGLRAALERVLRLPVVASKRFLTSKVDRSVTGLVAQQPCVGPLETPVADVGVVALSHFETLGAATALGEQPIKGLLSPEAGARLALAEALTNLVFARVTDLRDVKCSGNWMWGSKLGTEGGSLVAACQALVALLGRLGVAIDGGKDSLSMAARVGTRSVMAPGSLVISAYALCPDVTATLTPDLKCPGGKGSLLWVQLSPGCHRLGGSALAQVFSQLGDEVPDLEHPEHLEGTFRVTQKLLEERALRAGHDISDGGLLGCVLEMAFAGNCGLRLNIADVPPGVTPLSLLFAEEPGLVLEVPEATAGAICHRYRQAGVTCVPIGHSGPYGPDAMVEVVVGGSCLLSEAVGSLRALWEETSFRLEREQTALDCVAQEEGDLPRRWGPNYSLTFDPNEDITPLLRHMELRGPRVALLREEGSNGDREMAAAFTMVGFQVWDVTTGELCSGSLSLDGFRGLVCVGGFSYADVLGSAKGWAAAISFNPKAREALDRFRRRPETFSLGVCNGCQLLTLLGWVGPPKEEGSPCPPPVSLVPNASGRFESRFVTVRVEETPAVLLRGMEGTRMGVWVAHGEGCFQPRPSQPLPPSLVPLRYVDDHGDPTERYPQNPNGSRGGVAALCSPCGRHLGLMPHPERGVRPWQWGWWPPHWDLPRGEGGGAAPWLRIFRNAAEWCLRWPQGEEGPMEGPMDP